MVFLILILSHLAGLGDLISEVFLRVLDHVSKGTKLIEKAMAYQATDKGLVLAETFASLEISIEEEEPIIDKYYAKQMKIFEEIKLPAGFTPKLIIEEIRKHEKENPDVFAHTQKIANIQWDIGRYRALTMRDLTSARRYKELPVHLWNYLESLKTFYNFINNDIDEKRNNVVSLFFGTDVPVKNIDLFDLSCLLEKISLEAISKTVENTQGDIAALIHRDLVGKHIPLKTFFRFAVKRGGGKRVKKIIDKNFLKIHQIFRKTGMMEHARHKPIWYLRVWNAKTIEDLYHLGALTMKKVDEKEFFAYLEEFEEKYHECNKFLLDNFYDIFSDVDLIRNEVVQKAWDEMIDALAA